MATCSALVVDNDPFTLASIVDALRHQRVTVVAQAGSAREALELQATSMPDVALLDLDLGIGPNGIDLAHALRIRQPEIGLVILSTYRDPRLLVPGSAAPPRGTTYLNKNDINDFAVIVDTVIAAARTPLRSRGIVPASLPELTPQQLEVLRLVADGLSTQAIADARNVRPKAIEQIISRLSELLEVPRDSSANQRVQLARVYLEYAGKIEQPEQ